MEKRKCYLFIFSCDLVSHHRRDGILKLDSSLNVPPITLRRPYAENISAIIHPPPFLYYNFILFNLKELEIVKRVFMSNSELYLHHIDIYLTRFLFKRRSIRKLIYILHKLI